jgi:hypothetical protein
MVNEQRGSTGDEVLATVEHRLQGVPPYDHEPCNRAQDREAEELSRIEGDEQGYEEDLVERDGLDRASGGEQPARDGVRQYLEAPES